MKRVIRYIRQHLYLRLGLEILLILGSVFGLTLAILFYYSRQQAQEAAVKKANDTLNETVCKIDSIMDYTEKVTADMERLVQQHLQPDSLLAYSRQVLEQHPDYGFGNLVMTALDDNKQTADETADWYDDHCVMY